MSKSTNNGKRHATQQSLNSAVKSICDIMRRSNVAGAMNPNRVSDEHKRTPAELLAFIDEKGREADAALGRLRGFVSTRASG